MPRLVFALAAVLGWFALDHIARRPRARRRWGNEADAFPFPTSDSHAGIDLADAGAVERWTREFECTEEQLRAAVRHVGQQVEAIRMHLQRTR